MKGLSYLFILVANLIGGLTYLGQKLALDGLPPATVTLGRNLVALACMAVWLCLRRGVHWRYTPRELLRLVLLGVLAYAAPLLLGIAGVQRSTAGNGSILILLEPASILVLSWLLLGEAIRRVQVLGILAGLGGALLIVLEEASLSELFVGAHAQGNLMLALHGILWGLYSPVMKPLAERHRALDVTFAAMLLGNLLLVPAALTESASWQTSVDLEAALWWTLALGVFGSFAGTVLWTMSLRHLKASHVAPFVFLQPLAGVLSGHLVLDERLTSAALAGGSLIAAGVLLVIWRRRAPAGREARQPT